MLFGYSYNNFIKLASYTSYLIQSITVGKSVKLKLQALNYRLREKGVVSHRVNGVKH